MGIRKTCLIRKIKTGFSGLIIYRVHWSKLVFFFHVLSLIFLSSCVISRCKISCWGAHQRTLLSISILQHHCHPTVVLGLSSRDSERVELLPNSLWQNFLVSIRINDKVRWCFTTESISFIHNLLVPTSASDALSSISKFHYVDDALNCARVYITNLAAIKKIGDYVLHTDQNFRFVLHGTPRQWSDPNRSWIRKDKDIMLQLLRDEAKSCDGTFVLPR